MGLLDFLKRKKSDDVEDVDIDEDGPRTQIVEDDTEQAVLKDDDDLTPPNLDEAEVEPKSETVLEAEAKDEDEDEDEGEDEKKKGRKGPIIFVFFSIVALLIGAVGGAGYWILRDADGDLNSENMKPKINRDIVVSMDLPPKNSSKGGGLNAIGSSDIIPLVVDGGALTSDPQKTNVAGAKETPTKMGLSAVAGGVVEKATLNSAAGKSRQNIDNGLMFPSVTSVSYQKLPDQTEITPLSPAPIKQLLELEPFDKNNRLPKIGPKGRQAWQMYARPVVKYTKNPKVAFIVKGLGFSRAASMAAIKKLPGEVSLAFSPYATNLNDWLLRARLSGHEVFLELPLESINFPAEDAGPLALSSLRQVKDNMQKLRLVMSKMNGYVGLLTGIKSQFNQAEAQLLPILEEIKSRGLMFVDGGGGNSKARKIASKIELPKAFSSVYLDVPPSRRDMDQKLQKLDKMARKNSFAVAIVHAYPNTIERLLIWIRTMEERKLTLVPVSYLADKQLIK